MNGNYLYKPKKQDVTGLKVNQGIVNGKVVTDSQREKFQEKAKYKERMSLDGLITQAQRPEYRDNLVMQRRLQQKIAEKAANLYGMDSKKLMGGLHRASVDNYDELNESWALKEKVNGKK